MAATLSVELDQSQKVALKKITDWLEKRTKDPKYPQVFRNGGNAGSGKTTLITEVIKWCDSNNVSYALGTFAGKAANVLRRKGLRAAQTIHSLFYTVNPDAIAEAKRLRKELGQEMPWEMRRDLLEQLKHVEARQWVPREGLDGIDLIIIDEASMVDGRITAQLKAFGRPILAVGDPAQLGPINVSVHNVPLFFDQPLDAKLTGQHRFGAQELLGAVADAARGNTPIPGEVIVPSAEIDLLAFDMILVHRNETRWEYIKKVRNLLGKPLDRPVVGDRITFWDNNYKFGVFNGGSGIVQEISVAKPKRGLNMAEAWDITAVDDLGHSLELIVHKGGFVNEQNLLAAKEDRRLVTATHSEAMTVNKAQGSEWPSVLVAEHIGKVGTALGQVRWRYTAVTRAAEKLTLGDPRFAAPLALPKGQTLDALN